MVNNLDTDKNIEYARQRMLIDEIDKIINLLKSKPGLTIDKLQSVLRKGKNRTLAKKKRK